MNISNFNGIVIDGKQHFTEAVSFGNVRINGTAVFTEDAEAVSFEIAGDGLFGSFTTCDRLNISGKAEFRKKLLTESVRNTGECAVYGKLTCDVLVNSGDMRLYSASSLGRAVIKAGGSLASTAKLKADKATVTGRISVIGGFRGESIEITSADSSSIDSVYAEEIKVRRSGGDVFPEENGGQERQYVLTASDIDVFDADIEYSDIGQLCCDRAVIGPGCRIRELMYRSSVTIDRDSFAERLIKV